VQKNSPQKELRGSPSTGESLVVPLMHYEISYLRLEKKVLVFVERLGAVLIMAPNFLDLAKEAIVEALDLTSREKEQLLKLNKLQCKCVAQKLSETREVLQSVESVEAGSSTDVFERCEAALKQELYRVVTDALSLIKECCGEQWLRAAIRQRSDKSSEDFAEICYDLHWLTSLLCISLQTAASSQDVILAPEDCDGRLGALDVFKLETAAKQDREDLRSNLDLLREGHVCEASCARSQPEKCIAARFLRRLVHWQTAIAADPLTRKIPSSFWRVPPQDLPEVRSIGRGTFGEVYETNWLGEQYAKKVVREARLETFKTEFEILAGLCHPHVVRTVCWAKEEKQDYSLVMDLMQEDLDHFLNPRPAHAGSNHSDAGFIDSSDDNWIRSNDPDDNDNWIRSNDPDDDDVSASIAAAAVPSSTPEAAVVPPLSVTAAVDLMLQVARGLKYLHSKRIVHRDVKSSNILVKALTGVPELAYKEGYLSAKLADFGTSKTKISSTRFSKQTSNIGTTLWMAPEVYSTDSGAVVPGPQPPAYPFKADVYSFAVVCYEILTRKPPFEGEEMYVLRQRIKVDRLRPELPERCPTRLASLIQRCWKHNPRERPDFPEICRELRYIKGLLLLGTKLAFLSPEALP
jgi:serine/threonine protein kinase